MNNARWKTLSPAQPASSLRPYLYNQLPHANTQQNKKRSKALKIFLEDRRAVEPWEIDELRMANADVLPDRAAFQELLRALQKAFPHGTAPYREFIQVRGLEGGSVGGWVEGSGNLSPP